MSFFFGRFKRNLGRVDERESTVELERFSEILRNLERFSIDSTVTFDINHD